MAMDGSWNLQHPEEEVRYWRALNIWNTHGSYLTGDQRETVIAIIQHGDRLRKIKGRRL